MDQPAMLQFRSRPEIDPHASLEEQVAGLRMLILTTPPGTPISAYQISPALADYVLKHMNRGLGHGNRHFRPAKIKELVEAIKRNAFVVTGDTIKFGAFSERELDQGMGQLDGQNRFSAIAQAGKIVTSYVAFGIDPRAFAFMDVGANRTGGDTFVTYGVPNPAATATTTRWLKIVENFQPPAPPNRGLSLTNEELWKYYSANVIKERCSNRSK
jgi:hypothetical protein